MSFDPRAPAPPKQEGGAPPAPPPAADPFAIAEVELPHRGKTVKVPGSRAKDLAAKGFDYEQNQARLKAEREAFLAEAKGYSDYEAFRKDLQNDPELAEAMALTLQDPKKALSALRGNAPAGGGNGSDSGTGPAPAPADLEALRREVKEVKQGQQLQKAEQKATQLAASLDAFLGDYEFLKTNPKALEAARKSAAQHVAQGQDPEAAAALAATELKAILEGSQRQRLENVRGRRQTFRTETPESATPNIQQPPKRTVEDFHRGRMIGDLVAAARNRFRQL